MVCKTINNQLVCTDRFFSSQFEQKVYKLEQKVYKLADDFIKYSDPTLGTYRDDQDHLLATINQVNQLGEEAKKVFIKTVYRRLSPSRNDRVKFRDVHLHEPLDYYIKIDHSFRQQYGPELRPDFIRGILVRKNWGPMDRTYLARLLEAWERKPVYQPSGWEVNLAGVKNVVDQSRSPGTFWGATTIFALLPPQGKVVFALVLGSLSAQNGAENIDKNIATASKAAEGSRAQWEAQEKVSQGAAQILLPVIPLAGAVRGLRNPSVVQAPTSSASALPSTTKPVTTPSSSPMEVIDLSRSVASRPAPVNSVADGNNGSIVMNRSSLPSAAHDGLSAQPSGTTLQIAPRVSPSPRKIGSNTRPNDSQNEAGTWAKPPEMKIEAPGHPTAKIAKIENPGPVVIVPVDGPPTGIDQNQPIGDFLPKEKLPNDSEISPDEQMQLMGLGDWLKKKLGINKDEKPDLDKMMEEAFDKVFKEFGGDDPELREHFFKKIKTFLEEVVAFRIKNNNPVTLENFVKNLEALMRISSLIGKVWGCQESAVLLFLLERFNKPEQLNQLMNDIKGGAVKLTIKTSPDGEILPENFVNVPENERAAQKDWLARREEEIEGRVINLERIIDGLTDDPTIREYLMEKMPLFLQEATTSGSITHDVVQDYLRSLLKVANFIDQVWEPDLRDLPIIEIPVILDALLSLKKVSELNQLYEELLNGKVQILRGPNHIEFLPRSPISRAGQKAWVKERMAEVGITNPNVTSLENLEQLIEEVIFGDTYTDNEELRAILIEKVAPFIRETAAFKVENNRPVTVDSLIEATKKLLKITDWISEVWECDPTIVLSVLLDNFTSPAKINKFVSDLQNGLVTLDIRISPDGGVEFHMFNLDASQRTAQVEWLRKRGEKVKVYELIKKTIHDYFAEVGPFSEDPAVQKIYVDNLYSYLKESISLLNEEAPVNMVDTELVNDLIDHLMSNLGLWELIWKSDFPDLNMFDILYTIANQYNNLPAFNSLKEALENGEITLSVENLEVPDEPILDAEGNTKFIIKSPEGVRTVVFVPVPKHLQRNQKEWMQREKKKYEGGAGPGSGGYAN
jgi:hypothetical protein